MRPILIALLSIIIAGCGGEPVEESVGTLNRAVEVQEHASEQGIRKACEAACRSCENMIRRCAPNCPWTRDCETCFNCATTER